MAGGRSSRHLSRLPAHALHLRLLAIVSPAHCRAELGYNVWEEGFVMRKCKVRNLQHVLIATQDEANFV